jgi:site-specific recombinase XerD
MTDFEFKKLLAVIPERSPFGVRDRAMLTLLVHTGLRVGELTGLKVADVADLQRRTVRARLALPAAICKGRRGRTIPLNEEARLAVRTLLQFNETRGFAVTSSAPLLYTRDHQPLGARAVQRLVQGYRRQAGLTAITPHKFRHLFADRVLHAGGNSRQLQTLLGHKHLNTSEIYTRSRPDELANLVGRLS